MMGNLYFSGISYPQKYPPLQYDDKGKVRKATAAELTQLKGSDLKQPGYSAE